MPTSPGDSAAAWLPDGGPAATAALPASAPPPPSRVPRALGCTLEGWEVDVEKENSFCCIAAAMFAVHASKVALRDPQTVLHVLSRWEKAQNYLMTAVFLMLAVLSRARPAFYRRHSPALRLALLGLAYCLPVFSALGGMDPYVTEPSQVPVIGPLVDLFNLWMSTRGTYLCFALLGFRPPLHVAVPLQLFGIWRASCVDYCSVEILRHPTLERRIAAVHGLLSFVYEAITTSNALTTTMLARSGAEQRCKSLLLFSNVIFYFFVPLLLLLPSQRHGRQRGAHADADADADGERPHGSATALLNGWIERCLRPLMWPSKPRDGVQAGAAGEPPRPEPAWRPCINGPLERLVVCWGLLLLFVWAVCCLVHM